MDSQGRKVVVCDNGTGVSLLVLVRHAINPLLSSHGGVYVDRFAETGSGAVSDRAS